MKIKFLKLSQIIKETKEIFIRFPLTIISTLICAVILIFLIEVDGPKYENFETLIKIAFASSLGIFMFTAFRLMGDKNPLCFVGVALLVGYYFLLPNMKDANSIVFQRHFFLSLMFFIMILWSAFWRASPSNEQFWEMTQRVIFGFLTSIVFTIVLFGGISGALVALDKLFSLDIDSRLYAQLFILITALFGLFYFLSTIPKNPHKLTVHTYTKIELIFTKYILTPLSIGYFLILYTYTFKVLLTQSWPKGILAWIIIAFLAVAIITYLFWTPLWSEKLQKYRRYFFIGIILQIPILAMAIGVRISEYGWTESRYLVLLLGIWLFGISLYFLLIKDAKLKWMFISLTFTILVSQIGPFSSYEISKSSQQKRLQTILLNSKPLSQNSDIKIRYEISDIIRYLSSRHGIESLEAIIPKIVSKYKEQKDQNIYDFSSFATKELGFDSVYRWDLRRYRDDFGFSIFRPQSSIQNIRGYDWMVYLIYDKITKETEAFREKISKIDTVFKLTEDNLEIKEHNTSIAKIEMKKFYKKILSNKKLREDSYSKQDYKELELKYSDKNVSIKIVIQDISVDSNRSINYIRMIVLYKRL